MKTVRARRTPSPVPPGRVVKNGVPSRSSVAADMPRPVSRTQISTWSAPARSTSSTRPPGGVASSAFAARLSSASRSRRGSPTIGSPCAGPLVSSMTRLTWAAAARPSSTPATSPSSTGSSTSRSSSSSSGRAKLRYSRSSTSMRATSLSTTSKRRCARSSIASRASSGKSPFTAVSGFLSSCATRALIDSRLRTRAVACSSSASRSRCSECAVVRCASASRPMPRHVMSSVRSSATALSTVE